MKKGFLFLSAIILFGSIGYALQEYSGKYLDYNYTYSYKDGQYMFFFKPTPLPRDDNTLIGAMYKAIKDIDGKLQLEDTNPKIKKNSKGVGVIYFIGKKHFYNFLLMKNDNGTVYGFTLWKEYK